MAERGLAIAFEKASSWLSLYDKLEAFFSNQDSFFLHLPSFPAFLILLDRVSSF